MAEVPIQLEVERLAKGGFRATSPDVPGLLAQGRTLAETVAIAQDVARKLVESCLAHGDPLPQVFTRRPRKRIPVTAVVALTGARKARRKPSRKASRTSDPASRAEWIEVKTRTLFLVLILRGLAISLAQNARIRACRSPARLDRWLNRAASASSTAEVLGGRTQPAGPVRQRPIPAKTVAGRRSRRT